MSFWKTGFWAAGFWSSGFWVDESTVEQPSAGSGYPIGALVSPTGIKRKKPLESILAEQMRDAYNEILGIAEPQAKKQAAKIVRSHIEKGSKPTSLPPTSIIDWQAFAEDAKKVSLLLELWQREIEQDFEDEELLLMMMT